MSNVLDIFCLTRGDSLTPLATQGDNSPYAIFIGFLSKLVRLIT